MNWLSRLFRSNSFGSHFRDFLGPHWHKLSVHDKNFPGYDLASLHRALARFFAERCVIQREIGGSHFPMLQMLMAHAHASRMVPQPVNYERVPVALNEEESFATNLVWVVEIKPPVSPPAPAPVPAANPSKNGNGEAAGPSGAPGAPGVPQRAIIMVAMGHAAEYTDEFEAQRSVQRCLTLAIACADKTLASDFFQCIERWRRELCVFRGKVIDPVVVHGGIHGINFRAITDVSAEDLILRESIKTLIDSSIVGFYEHSATLAEYGIDLKRGVLFHGPPGTGKTSISLYLAKRLKDFTVCFVSGERLLYPREICRMARYLQPAMVVLEDIDLVAMHRDQNGLATVLGELMNQIDGCEPHEQVLFVMNTNSLDRLEAAVRNRPGRVDQIIELPMPDETERRRLIDTFARRLTLDIPNMSKVVRATDGAVPSMLKEIVKRAAVNAVVRLDIHAGNGGIVVNESDMLLAVEQVRHKRENVSPRGHIGFASE